MDEQDAQSGATNGGTRSLVMILLVVVALGLAVGWWRCWKGHRPDPAPRSVATCAASNLALSMGTADGTAGTIYRHAVVTNHGSGACTLAGYPAAFLLTSAAAVLGSGAAASPLYTPSTITLAAHTGQAHAVLGFPDAGNFDPGVCSANSASLELFLPDIVSPLQTPLAQANCPGFSVTALQAGS